MANITLIATFYSVEPFLPVAIAFSPQKIILIVGDLSPEVKENIKKVEKAIGSIPTVKVVKVDDGNLLQIAKRTTELIDEEPKENRIVVNVSGGRRLRMNGILYACYARPTRIYRIVTNRMEGKGISELPKLSYNLGVAKTEILTRVSRNPGKTVAQIAKEMRKTRGMIYQHLRELRELGYVDNDFNITDAGRLALL